jgi:4-amino-4-deoxy-L-arabinose transferase-like glycosyltransferase
MSVPPPPGATKSAATGSDRLGPLSWALALAAIALALYLYLGRLDGTPLQRGNEAMYASPPALMIANGDYLVPLYRGEHFLDKPILPFWIVAATYRVLGVSVFAERLPTAIAGLATALLLGLWVRRRSGTRAGLLAGLILAFSFLFVFTGMTFAADAFLTLAIVASSLILEQACRRTDGSDAAWGALSGAVLALSFGCKGLIGIVLPAGAVGLTLLLDRRMPVRAWRRGAWAFVVLVGILAPYHWAMDRRLGREFWEVFYWKNQFLRGASRLYMRPHRGVLYYVGVLAWGLFPWSFLVPGALSRRKPSSLPLGGLLFGLAFWSPLLMKREVYAVTLLPAAAALVGEWIGPGESRRARWQSVAWGLAAAVALTVLVFWGRTYALLTGVAGARVTLFVGVALAALAISMIACMAKPRRSAPLFAVVLACGLLCLGMRFADERFGRFDPLPAWGERVRAACAQGCDGFVYGEEVTSLEFYSGFDWIPVLDPVRDIPERMKHREAFVVLKSSLEPGLADLPYAWEVLERCPSFGSYSIDQFVGPKKGSPTMLSLVRIERP